MCGVLTGLMEEYLLNEDIKVYVIKMNGNSGQNCPNYFLQYQHVACTAVAAVHNSDSGVEWM